MQSRQSQVAIKVSREKISNTFHAELIANEIILLSQCRHKNIVNYLECYLFRERIWMVMEYCDGGTLTELYKGVELNVRPVPTSEQRLFTPHCTHNTHASRSGV